MSSFEPLTTTSPDSSADVGTPTPEQLRQTERVGLWCAVSLAALFVVAELSAPGPLILVAGLNYSFAAIAWTVLLYRQWSRGGLALPRLPAIWAATGSGGVLAAAGFVLARWTPLGRAGSVLLLGGLLVGYVGVGLAIVRMRSQLWAAETEHAGWTASVRRWLRWVARQPRVLAGVLGLLLGITAVGCLLLGDVPIWFAGAVLGFGIVPVPAVLSLLAEHALRSRRLGWIDRGRGRVLVLLGVPAALVVLGIAAGLTWLAAGALAVLALLVVAVVSATMADIAVVLLLLALMGVAAPTSSAPADPWPTDQHVIVALGDSYLSGEGARQFVDGTDSAGLNECRRARTAWPVLVADRSPFDGLVFLACSGAKTYNLRTSAIDGLAPAPEAQYPRSEGTQLQTYRSRFAALVKDPPLVVLSLGGNDAGFATIGLTCLAPGSCDDPVPNGLFSKGNLERVGNRLRQAYAQVRATFPDSPVVVIPYPDPIDAANAPCPQAPLEAGDVSFVRHLLGALDDLIASVATTEYGFYVAEPMREVLADRHLQLCDPENHGRAGINFVSARTVGGVSGNRFNPITWKHGSLHPNERGHAALARSFEAWLADRGSGDPGVGLASLEPARVNVPRPPTVPVAESYARGTREDCAKVDGPDACNQQATAWAAGQVGDFLLFRAGWLVLLVVLGAWWVGVALVDRPRFGGRSA